MNTKELIKQLQVVENVEQAKILLAEIVGKLQIVVGLLSGEDIAPIAEAPSHRSAFSPVHPPSRDLRPLDAVKWLFTNQFTEAITMRQIRVEYEKKFDKRPVEYGVKKAQAEGFLIHAKKVNPDPKKKNANTSTVYGLPSWVEGKGKTRKWKEENKPEGGDQWEFMS